MEYTLADIITYGYSGSTLYVFAPAKLSGIKKGRVNEQLKALAESVNEVVLDLSECNYLDSTFMGQLIALRKDISPRSLLIANPSPEARQILTIMGLHRIIKITMQDIPQGIEVTELDSREPVSPQSMLEAHELLSELSPENARRFEQVLKSLQDNLKNR